MGTADTAGVRLQSTRSIPKWEAEARDRVRAGIRKFSKPLADLVARDANEGDTRLLITDFLCDALACDLTMDLQPAGQDLPGIGHSYEVVRARRPS